MPDTTSDTEDLTRENEPVAQLLRRQVALEERLGKLETSLTTPFQLPTDEAVADRVIAKLTAVPPTTDRVLVLNPAVEEPPPSGAVPHPPAATTDAARTGWFAVQLVTELRLALQMYFDPRYRISRTTQFAIPGIVLVLVFNYFLFAVWMSLPIVNPILERLIDFIFVVIGYKLLTRELVRYREVLAYLARYGHPHDPTWR